MKIINMYMRWYDHEGYYNGTLSIDSNELISDPTSVILWVIYLVCHITLVLPILPSMYILARTEY